MPPSHILLSIAAGISATLLTLSALSMSLGGVLLSSLAQLPIFLVGLSLGVHAAALAAASSMAVASLMVRLEFGVFFGLAVGVPAVILIRQALLCRMESGTLRWYPPAGLFLTALGLSIAVMTTALPSALWPNPDQLGRARDILESLPAELRGDIGGAPGEGLIRMALAFLPGFLGIGFFFLLAVNASLAQFMLGRFGRTLRPSPALRDLALPGWFATGAAIAGIGALLPGHAGIVGGNLALLCAVGFVFAGLAVLHAILHDTPARGVLLAIAYAALLLFAPAIIVIAILGIAEPWLKLRERFAGPAPAL